MIFRYGRHFSQSGWACLKDKGASVRALITHRSIKREGAMANTENSVLEELIGSNTTVKAGVKALK
jgi:phosphoribosylpyrophosphate synthetase